MYRIAIIEDDPPTNNEFYGYVKNLWSTSQVDQFMELQPALQSMATVDYDLIISDINLGAGSDKCGGFKIAKALDAKKIPLLVVSGSPQAELNREIFRALDAWDYLQKPISESDFATQLERAMVFRQAQLQPNGTLFTDKPISNDPDLEISFRSGTLVKWKGRKVSITMTQIKLLEMLVNKINNTVTFEELFQHISSGRNKDNLRVHIQKIRNAFTDVDPDFKKIKPVTMVGYTWVV